MPASLRLRNTGMTIMDSMPRRPQLSRSTRSSVSALSQRWVSPLRMHSAVRPALSCSRTPTSGAVPLAARHTKALPCLSAMAAPLAPVTYCAWLAICFKVASSPGSFDADG
jgi:hypothetical protein